MTVTGVIGLGNMGSVLAENLVGPGHTVVTHDVAGASAAREGATFVPVVAEVARGPTSSC